MKKIGILLPCYNEEHNVRPMVEEIDNIFRETLQQYDYEIVFIDNCSTDSTVSRLKEVCDKNPKVKVILNAKNYMWSSVYYGISKTDGDCVISLPSDFQVSPKYIIELVQHWENGQKIICLIKNKSEEKKGMWKIRQLYNKIACTFSEGETLPNYSGGLYDRGFLNICEETEDPLMYLSFRSFICSSGYKIDKIYYGQQKRKTGKSKNNLKILFDISIVRFTESSQMVPKISVALGFFLMILSIFSFVACIVSIIWGNRLLSGVLVIIFTLLFFNSIQLIIIGLLGEYLMKINGRLKKQPMVIEKDRINF